jgi:hypothetical protein
MRQAPWAEAVTVEHVPREQNARAFGHAARLATTSVPSHGLFMTPN